MSKKIKIIISVICVIILIFCIFKFTNRSNDNGNLSNMGLVVQDNDTIYYNKYEKGIFSYKNNEEKQLTSETAYSLTLYKDKIYYITVADFSNVVIKRLDKNGENLKLVASIFTSMSKFFINDDYIYYLSNNGIEKIDIEGNNKSAVITDNIQDFYVEKNCIIYTNELNQICRASIDGSNNNIIGENVSAKKIQVVNKWIYYYDEEQNALFRLSQNGKENELISVLVTSEIYNVSGNYVYYHDKENSKIARMKIGNSRECDDIINLDAIKTKINIAQDELYYLDRSQNDEQTYQLYRVKVNGKEAKSIDY